MAQVLMIWCTEYVTKHLMWVQ